MTTLHGYDTKTQTHIFTDLGERLLLGIVEIFKIKREGFLSWLVCISIASEDALQFI